MAAAARPPATGRPCRSVRVKQCPLPRADLSSFGMPIITRPRSAANPRSIAPGYHRPSADRPTVGQREDLRLESHPPTPELTGSPRSRGDAIDQTGPEAGRIARARRSAEELEKRARTEFERARDRHASVRIVVQAFESDRRRAGGLLAGGLAYKVFLWQIPLVLFLVSAFGLVAELAGDDPADLARQTGMTAALASAISQAVAASGSGRWWLHVPRGVPDGLGRPRRLPWASARERAGVGRAGTEGELDQGLLRGDRHRAPRDRDAGTPAEGVRRPRRAGVARLRHQPDAHVRTVRVGALVAPPGGRAMAGGAAGRGPVRPRDPRPRSRGLDVLRGPTRPDERPVRGARASRS